MCIRDRVRTVATDGHRLALAEVTTDIPALDKQVIVPKKAVQEFMRILASMEGDVELLFSQNHLQAKIGEIEFVTKLIDGKFPEYQRVIPVGHEHIATLDRELLRTSLMRASILSNENIAVFALPSQPIPSVFRRTIRNRKRLGKRLKLIIKVQISKLVST